MKILYYNGDIITMANKPMPQAVLCENGKIIATGDFDKLKQNDVKLYDLSGKTLLPAFIDGHSHLTTVANTMSIAQLAELTTIEEIIDKMKDFSRSKATKEGEFLAGFGYDNNVLPNKQHPTKDDLDKVSLDKPIVIAHASGHMGVCNSKALELLKITKDTPQPEGGRIGKFEDGTPNGYLEETAFTSTASKIPQPDYKEISENMKKAQQEYFKYGISTIQEGLMGKNEWSLLSAMSKAGLLKADVVGYADIKNCPDILKDNPDYNKKYVNNLKIGGYKLFLDGSPQGKTAWMTQDYDSQKGYKGYAIYTDEQVEGFIEKAISEKQQILCHCNGDAAAQQFIDCTYAADKKLNTKENFRPVMIHAQLARPDQMADMAKLGMIASFFVAHTKRWGDAHLANFGKRAEKISCVNSANKSGVITTFHQDSPVLPPDMMDTVWCAVNRITANGVLLDPDEKVTVYDALKAITINAAYEYFEENQKGTIEAGKDSSFVILSENPLLCPKEKLNEITVQATIIRDEVVYRRD